ncbi:DEAD/DEAH box helicase [Rubrivivax sp. RP6-9]|uniref:DEAD/DEAH box helicase n=1 Tax=Rubrivivax sp. RP6-9 TaxID=3415750 RepID=UPI003CC52A28
MNPVPDTAAADDFAALGLRPALVQAAAAAGWHTPTPVQTAAIPAVLAGRDLLARAPTGAGKTAAFVLPLLQRLQQAPAGDRRLAVLVLAPTRELAAQTARVLRTLAPQQRAVLAVGGLSINPQLLALRGGVPLLVATPGRLLDLVAHNALRLDGVQCLVLDEADRLLDLGFADEVGRVLALLPPQRQTLLFSATLPDTVSALAAGALRDPLVVQAAAAGGGPGVGPDITQRAIVVDSARRTPLLRQLLRSAGWPRVLVFVATQHASERVADKLRQGGVPAAALHGDLSTGRRAQALADFGTGALQVLVATDLAARGIDVPQLGVVLNHDLPRSAVDHVHRIGRAGRAGAAGLAISFVLADAPGSEAHFRLIEKRQGLRVPRETVPGFEPAAPVLLAPADPHGGVKGRRKSKKDKLREAAALAAKAGPAR